MSPEDLSSWTLDYFLSNELECQRMLSDAEKRRSVPSLNALPLHEFRNKQLVRFQGMIQDTYNPEYYLDNFRVRNNKTNEITNCRGKFRDTFECLGDEHTEIIESRDDISAERQTCFVISVPCLNNWAKEKYISSKEKVEKCFNSSAKRSLDSEPMDFEDSSNKKRAQNISKNITNASSSLLSKDHVMNFPVPNENGKACIVKIYEETSYKLNQVINIVGFISLDPTLSVPNDSEDTAENIEFQSHNPPTSLIPRLHAVHISETSLEEVPLDESLNSESIRADLKLALSQILFGDVLAAEYMICHLISSVYLRRDLLSLGNFPLNVTNFSLQKCETFTQDFYSILASLIPKTHHLGITLDDLNNLDLIPKKDYDCNRLTSGVLQLSNNTHLVLDETKLTSGQVSANGRKNYEAMSTLISCQKVTYDFKFYTMEFQTDIPVLILSETKSMIPCERQIVLEKNSESENLYSEILEATRQYLKDETRIANIRNYLKISRHRQIEIEDKVGDIIQEDFVKMRQTDKSITAEDLHSLMVLARLLSLSYGKDRLTVDHWNEALRMETERKSRLRSRGK